MKVPIFDLKREYKYQEKEILKAIKGVLKKQEWILGEEVSKLEEKISNYLKVKYATGVASGTDALILSLRAMALKLKGKEFFDGEDEIITTPFTFVSSASSILHSGAMPYFVDIEKESFNIDLALVKKAINKKTKGIVLVHLFGNPNNMDDVLKICKENNLFLIEDMAQAIGAEYNGKKIGSFGDLSALSFFPSKNLGGYGDGGMVLTDDETLSSFVNILRKHGGKDKYNVEILGYNSRLDTIQAAVLLARFKYLEEFNEKRKKIAFSYFENLKDVKEIKIPKQEGGVYHQYTLRVLNGKRDGLKEFLQKNGISTGIYYPYPLHKMKVFEGRCKIFKDLKVAEETSKEVLSLPIEPLLKEEEILFVVRKIKEFYKI
jgi:dTDP-4-amino-4,6-dideoxygalactose transaminase